MKSDYFYSKSTKLYVARGPLKIDSRVKKAAEKCNLRIDWDDEGRINFIDFDNAKTLLITLRACLISPVEYWQIMKDAQELGDKEMVESLTSARFTEWLDRVYLRDGTYIDHPKIVSKYSYIGRRHKTEVPFGRPGWFNPEGNIDPKQGMPIKVELDREKFATSWKYWSPDHSVTKLEVLAPVRGYVTSVGKPSWDLGIPVDSRQPMLMIREARKKPLEPLIEPKIMEKAERILREYEELKRKKRFKKIYANSKRYIGFLARYGCLFRKSKELAPYKVREKFFNLLGILKIIALAKKEKTRALDRVAINLSETKQEDFTYSNFFQFVKSTRTRLKEALRKRKDIVFVMGHKNPDTDTVVSSLFEAFRNHLLDKGKVAYIPIVQNWKIPDEVRKLLGNEISEAILLSAEKVYELAKKSGLARWISVDQNREPEVQKYFISIIDHHVVSEVAQYQDLPKTLEIIGSCTALIVQKILGMGLVISEKLARILYGATLMDTENRVPHKMTPKDRLIMDYLKEISRTRNDSSFYCDLMAYLLNTDEPQILFGRDYKEDWGFGFAVAKIKKGLRRDGKVLKKDLLNEALRLAHQNNFLKNLPLTVLRITDYLDDNKTVNRERVYLVFNKGASPEFRKVIFDLLIKIIRFEFGKVNIKKTLQYIEFWGTGMQLSRKKTAPVLEPVVKVFNEYFYSPSTNLWVRRYFLKDSRDATRAAKKIGIKLSTDKEGRINYITYPEARALLKKLGYLILSLREYWNVLADTKKIQDIQMIESLQGSNFVEFLDTVIKDYQYAIEHPQVVKTDSSFKFKGKKQKVSIPKGKPGLIHPREVDLKTGIPKKVRKPNEYGNPELWRYWQPDKEIVIPVRSYIFLLKQPCWDGKFHLTDSFPNLGIRPCCKKVKPPKVTIETRYNRLHVEIHKEGDIFIYKWSK